MSTARGTWRYTYYYRPAGESEWIAVEKIVETNDISVPVALALPVVDFEIYGCQLELVDPRIAAGAPR